MIICFFLFVFGLIVRAVNIYIPIGLMNGWWYISFFSFGSTVSLSLKSESRRNGKDTRLDHPFNEHLIAVFTRHPIRIYLRCYSMSWWLNVNNYLSYIKWFIIKWTGMYFYMRTISTHSLIYLFSLSLFWWYSCYNVIIQVALSV